MSTRVASLFSPYLRKNRRGGRGEFQLNPFIPEFLPEFIRALSYADLGIAH